MRKITFETIPCESCGSNDFTTLYAAKDYYNKREGIFMVVKCNTCDLVYTNPRPIKKHMPYFYPDNAEYFKPILHHNSNKLRSKMRELLLHHYYDYFPERNNSRLVKIILLPVYIITARSMQIQGIPKFTRNGKLLDVGCSYGRFIHELKKLGWAVYGIEPNKKVSEFGMKNLCLNIICADIDDYLIPKDRFDVITMMMVLEHIHHPKSVLIKVRNALKKDGTLILSIPDFSGIESRIYKKYARTLHLPMHLTHFTQKTIRNMLYDVGFRNIQIVHQYYENDFISPLEFMKNDGKHTELFLKILSNRFIKKTIITPLVYVLSILGKTSRMTIYATK